MGPEPFRDSYDLEPVTDNPLPRDKYETIKRVDAQKRRDRWNRSIRNGTFVAVGSVLKSYIAAIPKDYPLIYDFPEGVRRVDAQKRKERRSRFIRDLLAALRSDRSCGSVKESRECAIDARPPKGTELLLSLLLPKRQDDPLLGDLTEEFGEMKEAHGSLYARWWYRLQATMTIWSMAEKGVIKLVERLVDRGVANKVDNTLYDHQSK